MPVSVVIPFAGDADQLQRQIAAVRTQGDADGLEIIVSANRPGGAAALGRSLEPRASEDRSARVRVVDSSDRPGPGAARNVGWRASTGDIVLFCDADDECRPGWVAAMAAALQHRPIVRGRQDYAALNPRPFEFSRLDAAEHPTKFHHLPFGPSSNLGLRRELLQQLGGFDERLLVGEDIDLCWRAQYAGGELGYAEGAVVDYRLRTGLSAVFGQGVAYGRGDARLLRLHRPFGARRTPADTVRGLAALGLLIVLALRSDADRLKLALELGGLVGRIRSSFREFEWAV